MIVEALREAQANLKTIRQERIGTVVNSLRQSLGDPGR
jgi:hypothetical protein